MASQLADHFSEVFRAEHRTIRDLLLDLVQAFQNRDSARVRSLVGDVARETGPHFRFEEESMYPALVEIFGEDYIAKLLDDHDRAILTARDLAEIASRDTLNDADIAEAIRDVRSILPHVSDCDGLSIMIERLPDPQIEAIFTTRQHAQAENYDLLRWATSVRGRRIPDLI